MISNKALGSVNASGRPIGHTLVAAATTKHQTTAAPDVQAAPNILSIVPFAIANGIQFAKIKPVALPDTGDRGVIATYNINANECVCSVPARAAVRTYHGCKPALDIPTTLWQQLPWFAQIALLILDEVRKGNDSKYADYLRVLPRSIDIPALWSPDHIQQLKCKYFMQQVQQQQQAWTQLEQQLQPHLSAAGLTADQFTWALSLARSRAFAAPYARAPLSTAPKVALATQIIAAAAYLAVGQAAAVTAELLGVSAAAGVWYWLSQQAQTQQQHALCPLLDMFNHSGTEQSVCEYDVWSDNFRLVAARSWAAGQQVLINYGSSSNDLLLQLYGFVETGNPQDRYLVRGLLDALTKQGLAPSNSSQQQVLTEVAFTLQGLPVSAADALEECCKSAAPRGSSSSASDTVPYAQLSQSARAVCAAAIQHELDLLGVDAAADEQLLQAFTLLPHKQQEVPLLKQALQAKEAQVQQIQQHLASASAAQTAQPPTMQEVGRQASYHIEAQQTTVAVADEASDSLSEAAERLQQLEAATAAQLQDVDEMRLKVSELEQQVALWQQQTAPYKSVAVRYRLEKHRLLVALLEMMQAVDSSGLRL